jgi:hypothetical protein
MTCMKVQIDGTFDGRKTSKLLEELPTAAARKVCNLTLQFPSPGFMFGCTRSILGYDICDVHRYIHLPARKMLEHASTLSKNESHTFDCMMEFEES